MRLSSFSITNFRSISSSHKVRLHPRSIIIGPNNEGKSNVVRAMVIAVETLRRFRRNEFVRVEGIANKLRLLPTSYPRSFEFHWERDIPKHLRDDPNAKSEVLLEFHLSKQELQHFRDEVKSSLNGTLPIRLTFARSEISFSVAKQGKGGKALSKKAVEIANFVSNRLRFLYIPSQRTAKSSTDVVDRLLSERLSTLDANKEHQTAIATLRKIYEPILKDVNQRLTETLQTFLPNIKSVQIKLRERDLVEVARGLESIMIDDGALTSLDAKGDGVQSLAALAIMKLSAESTGVGQDIIIAIEEPESHLHPKAIHDIRKIIDGITRTHQVILTTHSPIMVDRESVPSNIIVSENVAELARSVSEIREVLGVIPSDNLRDAEFVLFVEGGDDATATTAVLAHGFPKIAAALAARRMAVIPMDGATNLAHQCRLARAMVFRFHAFLDNDDSGRQGFEAAEKAGLISGKEVSFANVLGKKNSEIEDLYDASVYRDIVLERFGVDFNLCKWKASQKWSQSAKVTFQTQGKMFREDHELPQLKRAIAQSVRDNPAGSLHAIRGEALRQLGQSLTTRL
jgi:predicted ATPase